jgi:hypothetical protein
MPLRNSYGVGASLASFGRGGGNGGLASAGLNQEQEATQLLGDAAAQETERNASNKMARTQEQAGNAALGTTLGAVAGTALGIGPMLGGVLGGLASQLF